MATSSIRDLVTKGLREAGIVEVGGIPDAAEIEEGLDMLQGLFSSFFGNELGEQLMSLNYGTSGLTNTYAIAHDQSPLVDNVYIPTNVRLVLNVDSNKTLFLCPTPMDGTRLAVIDNAGNLATNNVILSGNGRKIESADSVTLNTNGVNREWFYRADLGDWVKVIDLNLNDISPLPREFDDFMTTALAIRLNPRYGAQTSQEMGDILNRAKKQFRARYRQNVEMQVEDGMVFLPSNPYWRYSTYSLNDVFRRGF